MELGNSEEIMDNKKIGSAGEDLACRYLAKRGYQILEKNKHYSRFCELDIIAQKNGCVVFVEVKTRNTEGYGTPFEAITQTKLQHLKTGIMTYINEHKIKKYRLDVIGITLKPEIKIEHKKNIGL